MTASSGHMWMGKWMKESCSYQPSEQCTKTCCEDKQTNLPKIKKSIRTTLQKMPLLLHGTFFCKSMLYTCHGYALKFAGSIDCIFLLFQNICSILKGLSPPSFKMVWSEILIRAIDPSLWLCTYVYIELKGIPFWNFLKPNNWAQRALHHLRDRNP
jgi:hypothetical protein